MIKSNPVALAPSVNLYEKLACGTPVTIIPNMASFSSSITDGYDNIADHIKNKIGTRNWEEG